MDANYDRKKADQVLQRFFDIRKSHSLEGGPQQINNIDSDAYALTEFQNPKAWRLTKKPADEGLERAEAVFRLQGVLCAFDLPPVQESIARKKSRTNIQHIHLRQSVTITSFGSCNDFDNAFQRFRDIGGYVDAYFGEALLKFQSGIWEGEPALSFHSRYFTLRRDAPTERGQDFEPGVDPKGVLKGLLGQKLVHTIDNKVKYSRRIECGGQVRYMPIDPSLFKAGDIVKVCFAFYCAPARGGKVVFAPHLRSLTLLDDTIRKEASESMTTSARSFKLKRVAWDMLDGETEEVEHMRKMTIC